MSSREMGIRVSEAVLALPTVAAWPQLSDYVAARPGVPGHTIWSYPLHAGRALGADDEQTFAGAAAVYAAMLAIHLVDDLLDEDPAGLHVTHGAATAANLASALQGASHALVATAPAPADAIADVQRRFGAMFLETAQGQSLDTDSITTEEAYWRAASTKTPPLLAAALIAGARLAGGAPSTVEALSDLAVDLGCLIQVSDDVADAMARPAKTDWRPDGPNLAILYARMVTGEHTPFTADLSRVHDDEGALRRCQRELLRCGAISYCVHVMLERAERVRRAIQACDLPHPDALTDLLEGLVGPAQGLLEAGVGEPTAHGGPPDIVPSP